MAACLTLLDSFDLFQTDNVASKLDGKEVAEQDIRTRQSSSLGGVAYVEDPDKLEDLQRLCTRLVVVDHVDCGLNSRLHSRSDLESVDILILAEQLDSLLTGTLVLVEHCRSLVTRILILDERHCSLLTDKLDPTERLRKILKALVAPDLASLGYQISC